MNEPEESDEEDASDVGNSAEGEESGGDPHELLISDEARQGAPSSGTATVSDTASAGVTSAASPNA